MSNIFFKGTRESVLLPLVAECPTDTGATHRISFKARFRCPTQDERREMAEAFSNGVLTDDDAVNRLIKDWQDVKDSNDEPVPFSEEAVAEAMQVVPYRDALVEGALIMVFGKKALERARQKNLRKPAAAG